MTSDNIQMRWNKFWQALEVSLSAKGFPKEINKRKINCVHEVKANLNKWRKNNTG